MIRNVFVVGDSGQALIAANFGECHSLGENGRMVSSLISAIHSFAQMLSTSSVDQINLGPLTFILLLRDELMFAVAVDDDHVEEHISTAQRIVDLFMGQYASVIGEFSEEDLDRVSSDFAEELVDRGLTDRNCGRQPDCRNCENRDTTFPVEKTASGISERMP
ncbi:hypothetical protein EU520_00990 [Candidatus Thorarchaeota archaeon]|nr:MAG: hypothetical protein EU520_00990 [Candidatus Thorarchaeota archaeon]